MFARLSQTFVFGVVLVLGHFVHENSIAGIVEYTEGHADIGLAFEPGDGLFLHYHFGSGAVLDGVTVPPLPIEGIELKPSDAFVRVSDAAMIFVPSELPFLGLSAGEPVWTILQSNQPGTPILGFAGEELDQNQFNDAGFRLTGFRGPLGGQFAIFKLSSSGPASVYMSTVDGISPSSDTFRVPVGGHDHISFGFTMPGLYELDIQGFASGPVGAFTDSGTFLFAIGNQVSVPEPGAPLFVLGAMVSFVLRRRKND
jgi:hypothetical protein